ncbi:MAG: hypothetical protein K9I94_00230 [Bacteroidales bacterium]|nr:hypothetical protein [Bacteroidales bacterium]
MRKNSWFRFTLALLGASLMILSSCSKEDSKIYKKSSVAQEGTITDIDGNNYNTVKIDNQVWMAKNLRVTRYRSGDVIGITSNDTMDISNEENGSNSYGFTSLPGGYRNKLGYCDYAGKLAYWWSSTEEGNNSAWTRGIDYRFSEVTRYYYPKDVGFSVRCVKD